MSQVAELPPLATGRHPARMNGHAHPQTPPHPRVRAGVPPAIPYPARAGLDAPPSHANGEPVSQAEIDAALEREAFLTKVRRAHELHQAYERGMKDGRVVGLHRCFWQGFGLGVVVALVAVFAGLSW